MSAFRRIALALVVLLLLVGCGSAGPAATSVPVTATCVTLAATDTPLPPTPTDRVQPPAGTDATSPTPVPFVSSQAGEPTPVPPPEPLVKAEAKTFGGPDSDTAYGIVSAADGGNLICGLANSTLLHGHGAMDGNARLVKTDPKGEPIWEKDYGGQAAAAFFAMIQAADGGYVLLGDLSSPDSSDNKDIYLVKVDEQGDELWSHTYGSSGIELGRSVQQTADGGYILIGSTTAGDDTFTDVYLVKTDAQGNEVWSAAYGNEFLHLGWGVAQMPGGGYALTGFSAPDHDARDILAMGIDAEGKVEWSRTWNFGGRDEGFGIAVASDGNVVISGVASLGSATSKIVLLKVDPQGKEIWKKAVGDPGSAAWHLTATPDGGYILGGRIGPRALMLETDAEGQVLWQHTLGAEEFVDSYVGPAVWLPEGGYLFVGGATRHGEQNMEMLRLEVTTVDPEADAGDISRHDQS